MRVLRGIFLVLLDQTRKAAVETRHGPSIENLRWLQSEVENLFCQAMKIASSAKEARQLESGLPLQNPKETKFQLQRR